MRARSPSRGQWSLKFERNLRSRLTRELYDDDDEVALRISATIVTHSPRRFPLDVIIRTTCLNARALPLLPLSPSLYLHTLPSRFYLRRSSRSSAAGAIFASTVTPAALWMAPRQLR